MIDLSHFRNKRVIIMFDTVNYIGQVEGVDGGWVTLSSASYVRGVRYPVHNDNRMITVNVALATSISEYREVNNGRDDGAEELRKAIQKLLF